ncbi:MAG: hypothetical protein MHM6MM_006388 [Cercozoa sp. M6MM]
MQAELLGVPAQQIQKFRVVLASASPRRREILGKFLSQFDVIPSTFEEDLDKSEFDTAGDYCVATALVKALDVSKKCHDGDSRPTLVLASDSIVVRDKDILEKPKDIEEAREMLMSLSDRWHQVCSAVVLCRVHEGRVDVLSKHCETTCVQFAPLSERLVEDYISTGEPFDKAGGYGYQGIACQFVTRIEGCYFNVVGLPAFYVAAALRDAFTDRNFAPSD